MKTSCRFSTVFIFAITLLGIIGCKNNSTTSQNDKGNTQPNELGTLQGDLLGGGTLPSEESNPVDGTNDVGVNEYLLGSKYGKGGKYSTN